MKFALLLLLAPSVLIAQLPFQDISLDDALLEADKEGKLVFLYGKSSWCEPCNTLEDYTFSDLEVVNFFRKNFISISLDMETYPGIAIAEKYAINVFPSMLFLNSSGKIVHQACGALQTKSFLDVAEIAQSDSESLLSYQTAFKEGNRTPTFLLEYLAVAEAACLDPEKLARKILAGNALESLLEEQHWSVFAAYHWDLFSDYFQYFQQNLSAFEDAFGKKAAHQKLYDTYLSLYQEVFLADDLHDLGMQALLHQIRKTPFEGSDTLQLMMELHHFEFREEWEQYGSAANKYVKLMGQLESDVMSDLSWKHYLYVNDHSYLKNALNWAKALVEEDPAPATIDIYASLLYKTGKIKKAISLEEKALGFAKELGLDQEHYKYQLQLFNSEN